MRFLSGLRSRVTPIGLLAGIVAASALPGQAVADDKASFSDFPFLVYCEYDGIGHAYYLSRLGADGVAIYLTPDRLAGSISIDGVERTTDGDQPGTCKGKTIEELRASGQAFDVAPPR